MTNYSLSGPELNELPSAQRPHRGLVALALFLLIGAVGCSRDQYKQQADREVYKILEDKWQDDFGQMVNYKVNDTSASYDEIAQKLPESKVINLPLATEIATRYNRSYQSQKESLYLSALGLTQTRHQYAQQWFGTIDTTYNKVGDTESTTLDSSLGVNQNFLLGDGIQVGTGLAIDWARFLTGDPQTSLGAVLRTTLAVPLLGAGAGRSARENLTQAERNVLYRIRSFNRYRKTFVISIINDYYRVLQQKNSVSIQEASNKRLIESTNQLRMEVKVGQRAAYDLGEAEQRLLSAEQSLVSSSLRYEQSLDSFKIKLAMPTDAKVTLDPNGLRMLETIGITPLDYTEEEAIKLALAYRLDLANTRDELEDSERKLILVADGLGVQLNLIGSANVNSRPKTDVLNLRFHEGAYAIGLEADLPFDRKAERNAYRGALIAVQQKQRGYDEEMDQIKLNVRDVYRNLAETADTYRIQKIGLDLAQKRVEVEKLSLKYGRGTVRLLLDSEDALVEAQNRVLGALVDHTIAKLNFFSDIGILQVRPDGMWEQKKHDS
ncbi:MAG: TolC family protein [Phycisphaerae bacterium]|nr:TolC family protein [Phycisphaerae bacterium]